MPAVRSLSAMEILDSRGRPTVLATCGLDGGAVASASVPSGASTGTAEALELRDGDRSRYRGLGCRKAVEHISKQIAQTLVGRNIDTQGQLDGMLLAMDGTPNKARLGANAVLAVSIAFARAHALSRGVPLYQHFADMIGQPLSILPRLTVNLFSGGKHAGGQVPIQDVLLVPGRAKTVDDALANVFAVYYAAADLCAERYGARLLRADEGGLAPPANGVEELLDLTIASIESADLKPGRDMGIAMDVASSHFYADGKYHLGGDPLPSPAMIDRVASWVERYPIVSVEDGLFEDDWSHWPALRQRLVGRAITLGDDLLCTNPRRIRQAIETHACDALLLKVNQIGSLTEAASACRLARDAGWRVTISARSGETEDDWLADLAVGWAGDQIKIGSITQSERLAKYNRLLAIEAQTRLPVVGWPAS